MLKTLHVHAWSAKAETAIVFDMDTPATRPASGNVFASTGDASPTAAGIKTSTVI